MKAAFFRYWMIFKRFAKGTSYPIPRGPFYNNKPTKLLFKIVFSNSVEIIDSLLMLAAVIMLPETSRNDSVRLATCLISIIFVGHSIARLLVIRYHKIILYRYIMFQLMIAGLVSVKIDYPDRTVDFKTSSLQVICSPPLRTTQTDKTIHPYPAIQNFH